MIRSTCIESLIRYSVLLPTLMLLFNTSAYCQEEKLEVEGAIRISNSVEIGPDPGTIRWTGYVFQSWNGSNWENLNFGVVIDIDGNIYKTVKLGTQEWMAENLKTSKYRNGDAIPFIDNDATGDAAWHAATFGAWCLYEGVADYESTYGKLYNWYAVNDMKGICPIGWHVPSDVEWTTLIDNLGGTSIAGGKMKDIGLEHWNDPNGGASNESGFTALPGGQRYPAGFYVNFGTNGSWWSSTASSGGNAWIRSLTNLFGTVSRLSHLSNTTGYSIRCLRD